MLCIYLCRESAGSETFWDAATGILAYGFNAIGRVSDTVDHGWRWIFVRSFLKVVDRVRILLLADSGGFINRSRGKRLIYFPSQFNRRF